MVTCCLSVCTCQTLARVLGVNVARYSLLHSLADSSDEHARKLFYAAANNGVIHNITTGEQLHLRGHVRCSHSS